ncbi:MAG: hypothetical protein HQ581_04875 [Planctomycetes bacterium]|nr:hypothetical protein [Planctomycetota bacterium]
MSAFVVDTNVAVVANGKSPQAGPQCVLACIEALRTAIDEIVVLDDRRRILREYMGNLMAGQPGAGNMFMKWVFVNQAVPSRCELVPLTPRSTDPEDFSEFPDGEALSGFDRSDRKFVAVALASQNSPKILNAVDSDWWDFRVQLAEHGVRVSFLCPGQFDEN